MENDDIKEGFICPICMKDLGNASVLQRHFEESHSDDKDTLRRMREAFGKAKRKIINKILTFFYCYLKRNSVIYIRII